MVSRFACSTNFAPFSSLSLFTKTTATDFDENMENEHSGGTPAAASLAKTAKCDVPLSPSVWFSARNNALAHDAGVPSPKCASPFASPSYRPAVSAKKRGAGLMSTPQGSAGSPKRASAPIAVEDAVVDTGSDLRSTCAGARDPLSLFLLSCGDNELDIVTPRDFHCAHDDSTTESEGDEEDAPPKFVQVKRIRATKVCVRGCMRTGSGERWCDEGVCWVVPAQVDAAPRCVATGFTAFTSTFTTSTTSFTAFSRC